MTLTIASQIENEDLVIEEVNSLSHSDKVLSLASSRQGRYIAHGDAKGGVVIRSTSGDFRRLRTAKAGGPVPVVLFHPTDENTLFVASLNGYVDSWTFNTQGSDLLGTVEVPGYITSMAINDSGTDLVIGFDTKLAVIALPLSDHMSASALSMLPHPQVESKLPPVDVSIDPQTRMLDFDVPRRVFFIQDDRVLVTFITGTKTFSKVNGSWLLTESVALSADLYMGGTSLSPSKRGFSAAGLFGKLDWYSLRNQGKAQISTPMGDVGALGRNFAVGVEHLDESTVVTGHNHGVMLILSSSSSEPVSKLGTEGPDPCQHVAFARCDWGYALFGAVWSRQSRSTTINITLLTAKGGVGRSKSPAPSDGSIETNDDEGEADLLSFSLNSPAPPTPAKLPPMATFGASNFFPSPSPLFSPSSPDLLQPPLQPLLPHSPPRADLLDKSDADVPRHSEQPREIHEEPETPGGPLTPPASPSDKSNANPPNLHQEPATPARSLASPPSPTPSLTTPKPPGALKKPSLDAKEGTEEQQEDQPRNEHPNGGEDDIQYHELLWPGILTIGLFLLVAYLFYPATATMSSPEPTVLSDSTGSATTLLEVTAIPPSAPISAPPTSTTLVSSTDSTTFVGHNSTTTQHPMQYQVPDDDSDEYELVEEWMDDAEWEEIIDFEGPVESTAAVGGDEAKGDGCMSSPVTVTKVLTMAQTQTETFTVTHTETLTVTKSFRPRNKPTSP